MCNFSIFVLKREEREHLEKEHAALVHFEIDKMKMDIENLKQDIQMKVNKGHIYSSQEGELLEVHVAEMKAEKNVTTLQVSLQSQRVTHAFSYEITS